MVSEESTVGILTERDIVRLLTKKVPGDTPVRDVCSKNIIYVKCNLHKISINISCTFSILPIIMLSVRNWRCKVGFFPEVFLEGILLTC